MNKLLLKVDNIQNRIEGYFPFTPVNIIYRRFNKSAVSILDIGCGMGEPMLFINRSKKYYTVGVEVFADYANICLRRKSHDRIIQKDIRDLDIPRKSYDVVLGLRIIEHFTKDEGAQLLDKMESIARKQVILITPIEQFKQSAYYNNVYQEHKYIWSPQELKNHGYKICLNGIKGLQKDTAEVSNIWKVIGTLGHVVWSLGGWIVYIFPSIAANMVAVKNL